MIITQLVDVVKNNSTEIRGGILKFTTFESVSVLTNYLNLGFTFKTIFQNVCGCQDSEQSVRNVFEGSKFPGARKSDSLSSDPALLRSGQETGLKIGGGRTVRNSGRGVNADA